MEHSSALLGIASQLDDALQVSATSLRVLLLSHKYAPFRCAFSMVKSLPMGPPVIIECFAGGQNEGKIPPEFCLTVEVHHKELRLVASSFFVDSRVDAEYLQSVSSGSPVTESHQNVLLGSSMIRSLPMCVATLLLLIIPAHSGLWNRRREVVQRLPLENSVSTLEAMLKELLLTDLLLSFFHKLEEVWQYRGWMIRQLIMRGYLSIDEDSNTIQRNTFREYDNEVFLFAVDQHFMNYNAWEFRRKLFVSLDYGAMFEMDGRDKESVLVCGFTQRHNGDGSAASYLLFLLHYHWKSFIKNRRVNENTPPTSRPYVVTLWRCLMSLSQNELRGHYDKGHESMWYLRLGLIAFALSAERNEVSLGFSWSLMDELAFVSLFADGTSPEEYLLSPVSSVPNVAIAECGGSAAWSSFLAARYGVQLLRLVLNS